MITFFLYNMSHFSYQGKRKSEQKPIVRKMSFDEEIGDKLENICKLVENMKKAYYYK